MPIATNLAVCTHIYHVPIPCQAGDLGKLRAQDKRGYFKLTVRGKRLYISLEKPCIPEAVDDAFWVALAKIIKRTRQPWWDLCFLVVDSKPRKNWHALSLYRIKSDGTFSYLISEPPEDYSQIAPLRSPSE